MAFSLLYQKISITIIINERKKRLMKNSYTKIKADLTWI